MVVQMSLSISCSNRPPESKTTQQHNNKAEEREKEANRVLQEEVSFFYMFVRPYACLFPSLLCVITLEQHTSGDPPTTTDPKIVQKIHAKKSEMEASKSKTSIFGGKDKKKVCYV
jgi:hypothetical protein